MLLQEAIFAARTSVKIRLLSGTVFTSRTLVVMINSMLVTGLTLIWQNARISIFGNGGEAAMFTRGGKKDLRQWVQGCRLESPLLKQGQGPGTRSRQFDGPLQKLVGKIRQAQKSVHFTRQLNQNVGAAAVEFGLVQVMGDFHHHRNLRRQSAGTANVLARNAGTIQAVEHSKHTEHTAVRTQQRHCQ